MSRCCACQDPAAASCRQVVTSADLAQLLYVQGLDENLCTKFATIASQFQLIDCNGDVISPNSAVVMCSDFLNQVCAAFNGILHGGAAVIGTTQLIGQDCTTYTIPETILAVVDSATINLTASGSFGHTVTATVNISADVGNIVEVHADGLYVPEPDTLCEELDNVSTGSAVIFDTTELLGSDCTFHTVTETPLLVTDTLTVDLTSGGSFGHSLQAAVKISAVAGQQLVIQADGLYVPPTSPSSLSVADSACIDMSISGAPGSQTISASPIISPVAGNQLTCTILGLYAAASDFSVVAEDTNCANVTVVESPTGQFNVSVSPIVSPAAGNILLCTAQGLFVPLEDATIVAAENTDCIDIDVVESPAGTFTLSATPNIGVAYPGYADGCNSLVCTATGLATPPEYPALQLLSAPGPNILDDDPVTEGQSFTGPVHTLVITNPSDCREAIVDATWRHPAVGLDDTPDPLFIFDVTLMFAINSATLVAPYGPLSNSQVTARNPVLGDDGNVDSTEHRIMWIVPPGDVITLTAQVTATALLGDNNGVGLLDTYLTVRLDTI